MRNQQRPQVNPNTGGAAQPIARNLLFKNNGNGTFIEFGPFAGITHQAFGIGAMFLLYAVLSL